MKTTLNEYDQQAASFLNRYGITCNIRRADPHGPGYAPQWAEAGEPHGNQYRVTLTGNGRGKLSFDFWGSIRDRELGEDPTPYDVLACVSADIYCPDSFPEFCSDYGYDEDSRRAFATWERCNEFGRELREFFREPAMQEDLAEIS
jgi:hypothetical protein